MIDIVNFKGNMLKLGFSKIYNVKDFKISNKDPRKAVESKKFDIITNVEKQATKDSLKQYNSGLNHIICKLANKNNVAVAFSLNDILTAKNKAQILGRIMQNIKLCRKFKVQMILASFADNKYKMRHAHDLYSLGISLGMTTKEAKNALNYKKRVDTGIKLLK